MSSVPMNYKMAPMRDVYYEEEKRVCCGKLSYKNACLLIGVLEIVYWIYYAILLLFAVIHHQRAWSIVFMSVNLVFLTAQVTILFYGVVHEAHKYLQTHLIFLSLTFLWDVVLAIGFFCLSVLPYAYTNDFLQYKGSEWNARTFGIVMGSLMLVWFVARFFATVVIYRYWKLLRALEGYGNGSDC
ncbi:unnamed protein product [Caenorhabditis sp. 36 PRJEB53466]|nr:unnamed protein product [Caenorhabditis sp. 36 PRJEB53466]